MIQHWEKIDHNIGSVILEEARRELDDNIDIFYRTNKSIEIIASVALGAMVIYLGHLEKNMWYFLPIVLMIFSLMCVIFNANKFTVPNRGLLPTQLITDDNFADVMKDKEYKAMMYSAFTSYQQAIEKYLTVNQKRSATYFWQKLWLVLSFVAFVMVHSYCIMSV